jgi:drug/metabolite transporter (DMT)-like permease
VRNRGIGRGRLFLGSILLLAAVISWATAALLSPHGNSVAGGTEHVRSTMVSFIRNSAIGTLALSALAAWLLFPARRPRKPRRDWAIIGVLAILVLTSLYQLVWLRSVSG